MAELLKQQQAAFLSMQSTLSTLTTNLHPSLPHSSNQLIPNNTNQTLQPTAPVLPSNLQNFIPPGELNVLPLSLSTLLTQRPVQLAGTPIRMNVPKKIKERVWADEFIDLADLL